MNKATANLVLAEVQAYVADNDPEYGPKLYGHEHEELSPGSWSICYEGGADEWAMNFAFDGSKVPGVFVDAINSCIIGVFDA